MKLNINPKTGIAYGLISSNALHPDVVDALMYGTQAKDLSYEAWLDDVRGKISIEAAELGFVEGTTDHDWYCGREEEMRTDFYPGTDETEVEGIYEEWKYGGPIIDSLKGFELKLWLESRRKDCCEAHIHNYEGDWIAFGPTPLIAAMRCYVASQLGEEVEIPEGVLGAMK